MAEEPSAVTLPVVGGRRPAQEPEAPARETPSGPAAARPGPQGHVDHRMVRLVGGRPAAAVRVEGGRGGGGGTAEAVSGEE